MKTKTPPIPRDLNEAVDQILSTMTEAEKQEYTKEPEDYPGIRFHFSGGMAMRNDWGLWYNETGIARFLFAHRIVHGDDRSGTIFKALWRRLHNLPVDDVWLAAEAQHYEQFWERSGLTWDLKPIPDWDESTSRVRWFRFKKP